jgi:heme exporter protein CcmD
MSGGFWREFLAMGGVAGYVWGSIGGVALCLLIEQIAVRHRHAAVLRALQRERRT